MNYIRNIFVLKINNILLYRLTATNKIRLKIATTTLDLNFANFQTI